MDKRIINGTIFGALSKQNNVWCTSCLPLLNTAIYFLELVGSGKTCIADILFLLNTMKVLIKLKKNGVDIEAQEN